MSAAIDLVAQPPHETCVACTAFAALASRRRGITHVCLCGAEYYADPGAEPEPRENPRPIRVQIPRPEKRQRKPHVSAPPRARSHRIPAYVDDVLRWDASVNAVEASYRGSGSPLLGVIRVLELGFVGTGCRGTKGIGGAPEIHRVPPAVDPVASARYRALRGAALAVTHAVIADGQGDRVVEITVGTRSVMVTLEQRIASAISSADEARRWYRKIADGDSRPALKAMDDVGTDALSLAAESWWSAV